MPPKTCYLKGETWVCLDEFYEFSYRKALKKKFDGVIKPVCTILDPILRRIQDCARNSDDISDDQHMIIGACLV